MDFWRQETRQSRRYSKSICSRCGLQLKTRKNRCSFHELRSPEFNSFSENLADEVSAALLGNIASALTDQCTICNCLDKFSIGQSNLTRRGNAGFLLAAAVNLLIADLRGKSAEWGISAKEILHNHHTAARDQNDLCVILIFLYLILS